VLHIRTNLAGTLIWTSLNHFDGKVRQAAKVVGKFAADAKDFGDGVVEIIRASSRI
jgi:hypothetical protein